MGIMVSPRGAEAAPIPPATDTCRGSACQARPSYRDSWSGLTGPSGVSASCCSARGQQFPVPHPQP